MPELVELLRKAYMDGNHYNHSRIYNISEDIVAKSYVAQYEANHEFELGRELHSNGIQVPKMLKIESLNFMAPIKKYYDFWFLFMQKIKGKQIGILSGDERDDAYRQYREQIGKVLDLGIIPIDSDWGGNSLYESEEKRLCLIDFEVWLRTSNAEAIRNERERINGPELSFRHKRMSI